MTVQGSINTLIDFTTGELYTLSSPYRGYNIRDYIIRYDFEKQGDDEKYIDLMVIYAARENVSKAIPVGYVFWNTFDR